MQRLVFNFENNKTLYCSAGGKSLVQGSLLQSHTYSLTVQSIFLFETSQLNSFTLHLQIFSPLAWSLAVLLIHHSVSSVNLSLLLRESGSPVVRFSFSVCLLFLIPLNLPRPVNLQIMHIQVAAPH